MSHILDSFFVPPDRQCALVAVIYLPGTYCTGSGIRIIIIIIIIILK